MIIRELEKRIEEKLFRGKSIILVGARQVGKTTLLNEVLSLFMLLKFVFIPKSIFLPFIAHLRLFCVIMPLK